MISLWPHNSSKRACQVSRPWENGVSVKTRDSLGAVSIFTHVFAIFAQPGLSAWVFDHNHGRRVTCSVVRCFHPSASPGGRFAHHARFGGKDSVGCFWLAFWVKRYHYTCRTEPFNNHMSRWILGEDRR